MHNHIYFVIIWSLIFSIGGGISLFEYLVEQNEEMIDYEIILKYLKYRYNVKILYNNDGIWRCY